MSSLSGNCPILVTGAKQHRRWSSCPLLAERNHAFCVPGRTAIASSGRVSWRYLDLQAPVHEVPAEAGRFSSTRRACGCYPIGWKFRGWGETACRLQFDQSFRKQSSVSVAERELARRLTLAENEVIEVPAAAFNGRYFGPR